MHEYNHIGACFERIKTRVEQSLNSKENLAGCLIGRVETFVPVNFGELIAQVKNAFAQNQKYWEKQACGQNFKLNEVVAGFESKWAEVQADLENMYLV